MAQVRAESAATGAAVGVAVVVDLTEHPHGTIVRLDVLPGAVGSYLVVARRARAAA